MLFIEVSGCLPMCGHGTIGTVTVAIEEGLVTPRREGGLAIEAPAGRVDVEYEREGAEVVERSGCSTSRAICTRRKSRLDVPELGELVIDLAYGGNFYAIVEPQASWRGLDATSALEILRLSPLVRKAAQAALAPVHPAGAAHPRRQPRHVVRQAARTPRAHARNAVFYGEKAIDRSPCGTGSSARMAQLVAKGRLRSGRRVRPREPDRHDVRLPDRGRSPASAAHDAIRPSVAGWARMTGLQHDLRRRPRSARARFHAGVTRGQADDIRGTAQMCKLRN